jgi:hypothetical protein
VKVNAVIIVVFFALIHVYVSAQESFEQYCYLQRGERAMWVPILSYQTSMNWRFEGRYNYEALNSFALYAGKEFSFGNKVTASFTPLAGIVAGEFRGGSAALNMLVEYKALFFSSQAQYTFSTDRASDSYIFDWCELGYNVFDWAYLGVSAQYTANRDMSASIVEPGVVLGMQVKSWTFPLYAFIPPGGQSYFVLGANYALGKARTGANSKHRSQQIKKI